MTGGELAAARTIRRAAGIAALLISVVALAGWLIGSLELAAVVPGAPPMTPSAAVAFAALGAAVALTDSGASAGWRRWTPPVLAGVAVALGLDDVVYHATGQSLGLGTAIMPGTFAGGLNPDHMSLASAAGATVVGAAVLLGSASRIPGGIPAALMTLAAVLGLVNLVAWSFGTTGLTSGLAGGSAVTINSAIALFLVAGGALLEPSLGSPFRILVRRTTGGRVARAVVAVGIVGLPLVGWVRLQAEHAGMFDTPFGVVLTVAAGAAAVVTVGLGAGIGIDHAERARAEAQQALQASNELLERLFGTTALAFAYLDPELRFVRVNRAFAVADGRAEASFVGQRFFDLYPDPETEAIFARVLEDGEAHHGMSGRFAGLGSDDRTRWDWTLQPVRNGGPAARGLVLTLVDVTQRDEALRALEHLNNRLEARNRELREFASVVSHDIRAPLRRLQLFAERITLPTTPVEEVADDARRIRDGAARLDRLVTDLLLYARIGDSGVRFEPVDLTACARGAVEDLDVQVREAGATVDVGDLPAVEGDAVLLRQLVTNLVANAVKFRDPDRPIHVTVTGHVVASGRAGRPSLAEIRVSDNGIGFEPRFAARIFAPFERLHGEGAYPGTGVGLAICQKVVERHGGTIEAEGRPGSGATFVVRLPLQHVEGP